MAESKDNGGSWWEGWLQTAKEKSTSALEMVKKDFAEYTCTMQQDTSQVVAATTEKMKNSLQAENTAAARESVKYGFTSFLEGLAKVLVVEAEDKETTSTQPNKSDPVFDRAKARLHAIQVDPGTYCNEPSGSAAHFEEWVKSYSIEDSKGDISELLVSKVEVRALYTKLVPSEISHADFWQRYFYKVHQLQLDEARKLALMKRAEQAQTKEDSIGWEDDWSGEEDNGDSKLKGEHVKRGNIDIEKECERDKFTPIPTDSVHSSEIISNTTDSKIEPETKQDKSNSDDTSSNKTVIEEVCKTEVTENKQETNTTADNGKTVSDSIKTKNSSEENNVNIRNSEGSSIEQSSEEVTSSLQSEKKTDADVTKTDFTQTEQVSNVSETDQLKGESECKPQVENCKHDELEIKMKEKGDVVVVNPDRDTPSSESSDKKESENTDDDWEHDFDIELTEEDMKAADEIAKKLNLSAKDYTNLAGDVGDEEWESWE